MLNPSKLLKNRPAWRTPSLLKIFGLCLLWQASLAHAEWIIGGIVPGEYRNTPQRACEYVGIYRVGSPRPYRLTWLREGGDAGGFYRRGFDVPGPALPNPENNYAPFTPSRPYCILDETYTFEMRWGPDTQSLTLLPVTPLETRPSGTGGVSTITLTAKVTSGSAPNSGVSLNFSVEATANSGGHDHHNAARPKGDVNPIQGTTDANG